MNTKIGVRQSKEKELLLEQFRKIPIIQVACEKSGVGRATYYRWRQDDPEFAKMADEALLEGSLLVNDMAESQLLQAIRNQNLGAIIFWLKHHHPSYANKLEVSGKLTEEYHLNPEQEKLMIKALTMLQKSKS
ncbi:MAG: phBC6A51 family helix-turn-helix protein [Patescibacteria group bacterium]